MSDFGGFGCRSSSGYPCRSSNNVGTAAPKVDSKGREALLTALKGIHESGDFSDMTIKCGADEYKVHKAIICPRSPYFDTMFKTDMKETKTSQVDLSDSDAQAVKLMVHYFYHLDYLEACPSAVPLADLENSAGQTFSKPVNWPYHSNVVNRQKLLRRHAAQEIEDTQPESTENTFLLQHCRVYALAEMCQVDDLKSLAASKFRVEVQKHWNHPDFFEAIQEIYATTLPADRELRDIVVDVLKKHKQLLDNEEYKEMVSQLDLAFELLMAVHKLSGWN